MTLSRKRLGESGEIVASAFLKKKGYRIVETNYRCRLGEIDIVAQKDETLVICEVKTRQAGDFAHPLESFTHKKIARVRKLGEFYWSFETDRSSTLRFDAIAIIQTLEGPEIEHLEDAF